VDIGQVKTSPEIFWKITESIVHWNIFKTYNNQENNCFHFIDDILSSIGKDHRVSHTSKVSDYLKKLRLGKISEMTYSFSDEIKKTLGCDKNEIKFTEHSKLDLTVRKLMKEIPDFQEKYRDDFDV
jgi:hypothetical protein